MAKGRYKSTIDRARNIRELTLQFYEPGCLAKCYKAVWKKHIYPIYPMCYKTYLNYLGIPTQPEQKPVDKRQLSLWDALGIQ